MITIYDRATMAEMLTRDLDPRLLQLLDRRFKGLVTPWGDLTDCTEWLIIEPGDTEANIVGEVGFSPLVEPMEGARLGSEGFQPFWDYLGLEDGHYVLITSFGSSFAYVLVIPDEEGVMPGLLDLCRTFAV